MRQRIFSPLRAGLPLAILAGWCAFSGTSVQAQTYTFTDLGTLPGGTASQAFAINNKGQVTGQSGIRVTGNPAFASDVFLWDKAHGMVDLGRLPGGVQSTGYGINFKGLIAGWGLNDKGQETGFILDSTQATPTFQTISTPAGGMCVVFGLNNTGQVTGNGQFDSGNQAFLWDGTNFTPCGTLGGDGGSSETRGIDNKGEIVGQSRLVTDGNHNHPFLWDKDGIHDLGLLPGATDGIANAISSTGHVVGSCQTATVSNVPFLWTAADGIKPLPVDAAHPNGSPTAINNKDQVVGSGWVSGDQRALLWQNGKVVDLNTLAPARGRFVMNVATGINLYGQIVGYGSTVGGLSGTTHAFLLTPTGP